MGFLRRQKSERDTQDERAVQAIVEAGGDLSLAREIDFYLYFSTFEAADSAARALVGEGFALAPPEVDDDGQWLLFAQRESVLSVARLRELEAPLEAAAARHGGEYDGWSAPASP
jgi:hypothetical protein